MYENGIDVLYQLHVPDAEGVEGRWGDHQRVMGLPGWCAGDPQMAVALYLFGNRDDVNDVNVVDWQPHEDEAK